jgi:cell division septation protein DedD
MSQRCEPSSQSSRRIRTVSALVAALVAATIFLALPATPAGANDVPTWLGRVNSFRQSQGLPPLQLDGQLSGLAQQQAGVMAANGALSHTPNLSVGVGANWTKLGENVGMGQNLDIIMDAFLNSPPHRGNLTDGAYTHIGIGIVFTGNTQWVVHRFMGVAGTPVVVTPEPVPEPVYVPPPAPTPRPTAPPTTARPTTTTTAPPPPVTVPEPEPEPVVVPAASAPDRAAAVLDALYRVEH